MNRSPQPALPSNTLPPLPSAKSCEDEPLTGTSEDQRVAVLWKLVNAYPNQRITAETIDTYLEDLADIRPDILAKACTELRKIKPHFPSIAQIREMADETIDALARSARDYADPSLDQEAKVYLRRFYACDQSIPKPERIEDEALRKRVYFLWPEIAKEQGIDMLARIKALSDELAAKLKWPSDWRRREQPWGR